MGLSIVTSVLMGMSSGRRQSTASAAEWLSHGRSGLSWLFPCAAWKGATYCFTTKITHYFMQGQSCRRGAIAALLAVRAQRCWGRSGSTGLLCPQVTCPHRGSLFPHDPPSPAPIYGLGRAPCGAAPCHVLGTAMPVPLPGFPWERGAVPCSRLPVAGNSMGRAHAPLTHCTVCFRSH